VFVAPVDSASLLPFSAARTSTSGRSMRTFSSAPRGPSQFVVGAGVAVATPAAGSASSLVRGTSSSTHGGHTGGGVDAAREDVTAGLCGGTAVEATEIARLARVFRCGCAPGAGPTHRRLARGVDAAGEGITAGLCGGTAAEATDIAEVARVFAQGGHTARSGAARYDGAVTCRATPGASRACGQRIGVRTVAELEWRSRTGAGGCEQEKEGESLVVFRHVE